MRNKLRRSKACKNVVPPAEDQAQNTEVIILSAESSCSSDELPLENSTQIKQHGSSTVTGSSQVQPLEKPNQSGRDATIAPRTIEGREVDLSTLDKRLKEIQTSNPTFPVNRVFDSLQKKAEEGKCLTEKSEQGHESYGSVHKRQRSSVAEDNTTTSLCLMSSHGVQDSPVPTPAKPPRPNRLSRTRRLKNGSGKMHQVSHCESEGTKDKLCSETPSASDIFQRESFCEDVLWTDKYSPQHSSEVIGNSVPVETLHSWLKKWKIRTDSEERRKYKEKQQEENSDDFWDRGDFQDEVGFEDKTDEPLCNAILLTGPPGIGKTSSVYACALELGFKVFEVNCSSQRCGREVLSQLKEATQSHLVELSVKDPLKPAFFNSYSTIRCRAISDAYTGGRD